MLATTHPDQAVELLDIEHDAVRALIQQLTAEEMTLPDTIRYGLYPDQKLSFKDLLAHLITYEAYSLEALEEWKRGGKHWISDAMQSSAKSRRVHFSGIEDRQHKSLEDILDEWESTQTQLKQKLQQLSDEDWHQPAPYPTAEATDLGGMMEAILVAPPRPLYRHLPVHIPDTFAYIQAIRQA